MVLVDGIIFCIDRTSRIAAENVVVCFAVVYPALYIFVFIWFIQLPATEIYVSILVLHFLAMFCMFYCLRFVAKTLVECETGKKTSFYEYAGPFFLIWFFPIGIWFVQPRINRLYQKNAVAVQGETTAG